MQLDKDALTVRDAQAFHEYLDQAKRFDTDMLRNVAYLTSEVGEVVMAIRELKNAEHGTAEARARAHMGEELADCLAYLLKLANYADVDLQAAYVKKMQRNLSRTWQRFETE